MADPIFVVSDYYATGEGCTISILITRAFPRQDDYDLSPSYSNSGYDGGTLKNSANFRALREFIELFGGWYGHGAEILSKDEFLSKAGKYIPDMVVKMLDEPSGHLHYHSQFHINFS
jgi:hypothetical protein